MDFGSYLRHALPGIPRPHTSCLCPGSHRPYIHFGYTGLLNFGQAAFVAMGAYGVAISTLTFGVPFFVGLLIAIVCSAIFALLLGIPTLRPAG